MLNKLNLRMKFRYLPLGDSYTIGEGAKPDEAWPNVLVDNLKSKNVDIDLVGNPSVTGYTSQQLIDNELPVFDKLKPTLSSVLIGVNDWVQKVSADDFEKNLICILDYAQERLEDKSKLFLVTIPDFGVTSDGKNYSGGRDISEGITEFNNIIKKQAKSRNLPCIDIFPISKRMKNEPDLVAEDNLHGSAKMYSLWEELIRPEVIKLLREEIRK